MEKRVEGLVRQFRDARRHRLRFEALVTALSVLVTGGVFWQLRKYGTALGESGPETEQPGAGRTVVETDADPPEETIRSGIAESPEDWEAGLPEFTDETTQQRIAAIAVSQLGYTEGGEIQLSDVGTSRTGYTRYGAWYGNPYGEWNTMFTYFCMYYAGIEKTEIPYGSGCWAWYETLSGKDMIAPCGNEQIGDILFFDTDSDGEPDRTGIVSGTGETEDGVLLSVIEGNCEGAVAEVHYLQGGSDMLGVLSADAYAVAEASLPPEVVLIDYSADSESGIHVDAQAAEGVFPEGTVMRAADVAEDEAIQAAQDTLGENAAIRDAVAVDISFYTADGEEIEPADGNAVSVRISLPAEKQLSGDVYTLVHVDDDGEGELVADAQVASDGAAFIAESFSTYVVTSFGREFTFNNGDTITLKVGEEITLTAEAPIGSAANHTGYFKVWSNNGNLTPAIWDDPSFDQQYNAEKYTVDPIDDATERHKVTFMASSVTTNDNLTIVSPTGEQYHVQIGTAPIMVNSSHGFKDVDRIREWLGEYKDGTTYGLSCPDYWHLTNIEGYVPNSKERPYFLTYDSEAGTYETAEFYSESSQDIPAENAFKYYDEGGNDITSSLHITSEKITLPDGRYRYIQKWDADRVGYVRAVFQPSQKQMWFKVWSRNTSVAGEGQLLNHADMEIADGGTYSISSTYSEDDNTYVEVKVYKADVVYVNDAYIYDREKNVLRIFTSEFDPDRPLYRCKLQKDASGELVLDSNGNPIPVLDGNNHRIPGVKLKEDVNGNLVFDENGRAIPLDENDNPIAVDGNYNPLDPDIKLIPDEDSKIGDYEQFGVPGGTQYELTSAWIHNVTIKGNSKTYDAADADTAKFDVNLKLTPQKIYVYQIDSEGKLTPVPEKSTETWTGPIEPRDHIIFNMDHQDVLDAMNKCPLNNGLDFTARAEFTVLEMPVQKIMVNGDIPETGFTFDVIDLNTPTLISTPDGTNIAASATCGSDGEALLKDMRFIEEGTYHFKVRERIPSHEGMITYDDTEIKFDVEVSKDEKTGFLIARPIFLKDDGTEDKERKKIEFTNYHEFLLPDTGGTGTLPYLAGGTILISAAFLLPLIRRRKEDECDS